MQTPSILAVFTALVISFAATDVWGQGGRFGGGVIAPGSPAITLSGTSGGPRQAQTVSNSCRGHIAMVPDHIFTVTTPMTVRFQVINASGDTTMVIVGPSGVLCDDDGGNGHNPMINRHILPGQYQVYVGSYSSGAMHPYTIQISGNAPAPVAPVINVAARFGAALLNIGQMFATLSGTSGGPMPASNYGASCRGYVTAVPSHVVNVMAPMVVTFDVTASGDTTMVIVGPGGTMCNDDGGNGSNPRITRPLQPGTYQVYVGSYSRGSVHPYTLSIHP